MTVVEISVCGSHTVTLPPEQATVYANLAAEGPQSQPVFDAVAAALADTVESLQSRHHAELGPVTKFAVEQVRRSSYRPHDSEGRRLAVVHSASASITATFSDFDDLAAWVGWTAGVSGLAVNHISWTLTDAARLRIERDTRQEAVRDAARRAQDYADALDLGRVSVRAISDRGAAGGARNVMLTGAMYDGGAAPQISLRPDDVAVEAQVNATFVAGLG